MLIFFFFFKNYHQQKKPVLVDNTPKEKTIKKNSFCQESFKTGGVLEEVIKCGIYRETDDRYIFLGKLEDIYLDNKNLIRVKIQLFSPDYELKSYDFVIGKYNQSYTWITLQKEKTLFHTEENYRIFERKLDFELLEKLKEFKDSFLFFTILKKNEEILKPDFEPTNEKYKDDLVFRKDYFKRCNHHLENQFDFEEIEKNCGYLYLHDLTLFKSNLEL